MSRTIPTVWMNVTTSSNWQRPAVGVVRVEQELTQGLEAMFGTVNFKRCVWNHDRFVDLDVYAAKYPTKAPAAAAVAPAASAAVATPPAAPLMFPLLGRKAALAAMAQAALSLTPARFRPGVNRLLMSAKFRTQRYLQKRNPNLAYLPPVQAEASDGRSGSALPGAEFKAGDILLSVGLDWDYPYWRSFAALRKVYGVKVVTCCYDLIPVLYPQYCVSDVAKRFTGYFIDVAEGSDLTLCISRQSQKDLVGLLDQVGGVQVPTHIFPLGDNVQKAAGEPSAAVAQLAQEPYILFVSTIERRKNHEVLYRAYHLLCAQGHKDKLPKLVFVGMPGWGVSELLMDMQLDPLVQGKIVQLNHVSDNDLSHLYRHATFFVFPSLYEGWGLPVGEALAMGKAVLCSDRGSLPEVGGDLVQYVDPWSPQAWADAILTLSTDKAALAAMEHKVQTQYRIRTWQDACLSVKGALDAVIAKPFQLSLQAGYDMRTEAGLASGPWIRGQGVPGLLMAGPARSVAAGSYRLQVWGRVTQPGTESTFEVVSDSGAVWLAPQTVRSAGVTAGHSELLAQFEVHFASYGHAVQVKCALLVGSLDIERVVFEPLMAN